MLSMQDLGPVIYSPEEDSIVQWETYRTQKCSELVEKTKHRSHSSMGDQRAQFSSHLAVFREKGFMEEVQEGL